MHIGMRKRIGFILIILFIIIGCDWLVGAVTGQMIRNVRDVGVNQTNTAQALFSRKADVLILGSSRANHSFDCKVLEDSLDISCYNAGRDGQNMIYDAMVFFSYIERHVPKIVILDIASSMMDDSWFGSLKDMNCYYGLAKPLDRIIDENSTWMERLKLKSNLYKYNNTWQWLLNSKMAASKDELDGYRPMPVSSRSPFQVRFVHEGKPKIDKRCLCYLEKIRKACQEHHILLILTYSPTLVVCKSGGEEEWLMEYSKQTGLTFYAFGKDKTFYEHPEYFYDPTHLNAKGATVFTKEFVKRLKAQK